MTVSVVIPTYNRPELLRDRSVPSVLVQMHTNWELHIVGDGTDRESESVANWFVKHDSRVRFTNLPRQEYPADPQAAWGLSGIDAINHGWDTATGEWLIVLGDDDEIEPDGIEIMLSVAEKYPADVIYGMSMGYRDGSPTGQTWGSWPPGRGQLTEGGSMRRTALPYRYDKDCGSRGLEGDADLWLRMLAGGVTFAFKPVIVHRYWQR